MAEGESFVIAGGALADRGLFPVWQAGLAAFGGTVFMDQICFAIGRRCRDWAWVRRLRERPAMQAALGFVERHPNSYVIGFRYLYGLRIISPLAIGLTRIGWLRFLLLNTASALVWATGFTALGVAAGSAMERIFGRVESGLALAVIIVVLVSISGAVMHRVVLKPEQRARP